MSKLGGARRERSLRRRITVAVGGILESRPSRERLLPGLVLALLVGCSSPTEQRESCTGFTSWQSSAYVLPYSVGAAFLVDQANCSPPGNGHRGSERYGYDFLMPIGTLITAARAGVVIQVEESHSDGEIARTGFDNYVVLRHGDGTVAMYGHLTHAGVLPVKGEAVEAGDSLGFSGNTGNTAGKPHLHFSVHACDPVALGSAACPSSPVTFYNTAPNPDGLVRGRTYEAFVP